MNLPVCRDVGLGGDATLWHLHWQAALGRSFLAATDMHLRIHHRLLGAHATRATALLAYSILPTEIHVLNALPAGKTPAAVARSVGNVLSRWVREVQPICSPVLAGPYRTHGLADADDLHLEFRMLAWRPVRLGLCSLPFRYAHSTLRIALGLKPANGFDVRPLLGTDGDTVVEARGELRKSLRTGPSERQWQLWELTHHLAPAQCCPRPTSLGFRAVEGAAARLVAAAESDGITGALALLEIWIAAKLDASGELNIRQRFHPLGARARALLGCLATEHHLCSAASVARHFGVAKATLSEQMTSVRKSSADARIVATDIDRIIQEALELRTQADR